MGSIFKIAARNIWRHKRRTFLTAIIISAGLLVYISMDSLMTGINRSAIENLINLTESSFKIYTSAYDLNKNALPLKYGVTNYNEIESFLKNDKLVSGVTPRTSFLGELISGPLSLNVIGSVIDPEKDKTVFTTSQFIQEGRYFSTNSTTEILLGKKLADDLKLKVGDIVTFQSSTKFEANNAVDFEIVGLLNTPDPNVNSGSAYITYQAANEFLDLGGLYTEADVRIDWKKGLSAEKYLSVIQGVMGQLKQRFPEVKAYNFNELAGGFLALLKQKSASIGIMSLLILLIAAIGIVNSVLMSVYERIREVGVLKAMGIRKGEIMRMFMYEGVLIGFIGSIIGVVLAFLANLWLIYVGYDVTSMMKNISTQGIPMSYVFFGQWNPGTFVGMFIFGIIISVIASYVPARKAALMHATECLHFV